MMPCTSERTCSSLLGLLLISISLAYFCSDSSSWAGPMVKTAGSMNSGRQHELQLLVRTWRAVRRRRWPAALAAVNPFDVPDDSAFDAQVTLSITTEKEQMTLLDVGTPTYGSVVADRYAH